MKSDRESIGRADEGAPVSAAEQVSETDVTGVGSVAKKGDPDGDWLSMTTGDPALYLKDAE